MPVLRWARLATQANVTSFGLPDLKRAFSFEVHMLSHRRERAARLSGGNSRLERAT